ncbi:response regulator [Leptolyngbyaceae cyanobacterium CCMR0081]|uniref:histidine kinase n=1 Tax=Adonisia turfae CCMR0081 TaxID=2292702 RepID=A0A6M0RTA8_9CYAN|nr:response regulator [Adonisia turfae CCMR0081]
MAENRYATQTLTDPRLGTSTRVLLIEDSAADARLLQEFLRETLYDEFLLTHVERLGKALQQLQDNTYDVVLLDLTLPDSDGLSSLNALLHQAPSVPIVVLTNTNNPELAVEAVRQGAQDYLIKRQMHHEVLVRSLRYAIERKQQAEALRAANEALEHRVQARTRELELANQRLRQEVNYRQTVQERLALAQKAGKTGIFEWNIRSNEVTWSAELEALYGVSRGDFDGSYDNWIKAIHSEDRSRVEQDLWRSVTVGKGLNSEFRISHPSGIRWISVSSRIFNGEDGKPLRMLGIHLDITEKKQLESQFLQAQRLESLGALASGIAHDLNNILTPILAAGQLLPITLETIDERSQQLIETLNCSAQRGIKLVQQILSFAQDGKSVSSVLSIGDLLAETNQIVKQTLPQSINVHVEVPADLWLVKGNETQLHQVFMNLCVNARDAMSEGGILRVSAKNLVIDEPYLQMHGDATPGPHVMVTVTDTGTGIAPEIQEHIFDPFFTTKSTGQGTGLGLAAVLNIVKSHNGFITMQTAVGEGSQFHVYLPADPNSVSVPTPPLELLCGHQEVILVVDDDPAICKVMRLSLETYGYQVLIANDGLGAIAMLAEHRALVRCILIDLMMPDMDGQTAIPLLQRLQPEVKVVAMTGAIIPTQADSVANELRLDGTLNKPFTTRDLLMLLQKVLVSQG